MYAETSVPRGITLLVLYLVPRLGLDSNAVKIRQAISKGIKRDIARAQIYSALEKLKKQGLVRVHRRGDIDDYYRVYVCTQEGHEMLQEARNLFGEIKMEPYLERA